MEALVIIGIIIVICVVATRSGKESSGSITSTSQLLQDPASFKAKQDSKVFRPSSLRRDTESRAIQFIEKTGDAWNPSDVDIRDVVDALTGAPLQLASVLFQCQRCKVFYQAHSFEVIQTENGGRCVSCLHSEIINVTARREHRGRNADVRLITLENYRQHVGHVITFEGHVHKVLTSRRGVDYAVMFEDKSWTRGFKMVVFRGDVQRIGGAKFLFGLIGHRVRVRGLLIQHERFGYEIIVSDRTMILGIQ